MVPVPKDLKFKRDKRSERKLLNHARKFLESEGRSEGVHASDLLDPRKSFFKALSSDKKDKLSDGDVMRFYTGKILHVMMLNQADEGSKSSVRGFDYSVDLLVKGVPIEFKASATPIKKDVYDPTLQQYIEQLLIYMAEEDSTIGKLWVLFTNARDETYMRCPQFRCAIIEVSRGELDIIRQYCYDTTKALKRCFAEHKSNTEIFRILPLCRATYCTRQYCKWYDQCKPETRWKPPRRKT